MGILGDYICKDCGYGAPYSELAEAHIERKRRGYPSVTWSKASPVLTMWLIQPTLKLTQPVGEEDEAPGRMDSSRDRDNRSCLLSRPAEIHLGWLGYDVENTLWHSLIGTVDRHSYGSAC